MSLSVQKGVPKSDATAVTGDTSASSDSLAAFLNTDSDEVLQDYFRKSLVLSAATLEGIEELGIGQQELKDLVESSTDSLGKRFEEAMGESAKESAKPEEFKRLEMQLAEKRALARKMAQEMRSMKKRHEEEKARMRAEKMVVDEENRKLWAEIGVLTGKKPSRPTLANVPTNHPAAFR